MLRCQRNLLNQIRETVSNDIPIARLKEVRRTLVSLEEEERCLNKPVLTDLNLLPDLHKWFMENDSSTDPFMKRRKFLFLVLCLYSVGSILGDRLPTGLRPKLCEIYPSLSACTISNNIYGLDIEYFVYSDFREDINRLYGLLMESKLFQEQSKCLFDEGEGLTQAQNN